MASSVMVSSAAAAAIGRAAPAQSSSVAPFNGLKSTAAFPVTRKPAGDLSTLPSNGGRVQCMKVRERRQHIFFKPVFPNDILLSGNQCEELSFVIF